MTTQLFGTPKRRFVGELAVIWAAYRPDALSAGAGAPFAKFVRYVWEWTTGEADAPKGLAHDVKAVLPLVRSEWAQRNRAYQHDIAADKMSRLGYDNFAEHFRRRAAQIRVLIR